MSEMRRSHSSRPTRCAAFCREANDVGRASGYLQAGHKFDGIIAKHGASRTDLSIGDQLRQRAAMEGMGSEPSSRSLKGCSLRRS